MRLRAESGRTFPESPWEVAGLKLKSGLRARPPNLNMAPPLKEGWGSCGWGLSEVREGSPKKKYTMRVRAESECAFPETPIRGRPHSVDKAPSLIEGGGLAGGGSLKPERTHQ